MRRTGKIVLSEHKETRKSVLLEATRADSPPEAELLLCCARTCLDSDRAERIEQLLQDDIDWAFLLRAASRHGLLPLLYWHLNTICPKAVPAPVLAQLQQYFQTTARRNLFLMQELLRLLDVSQQKQIPAIPLKGPVLAATVYGNLALRPFGDLDLLVHRRDISRATDLLLSEGYQRVSRRLDKDVSIERPGNDNSSSELDPQEVAYLGPQYYTFVRYDGRVRIDLQWRITRSSFSFSLDAERLWERLEPVSLSGSTILTFSPQDLCLILCVHGAKHMWEELRWVCDVSELIHAQKEVDWEQVLKRARKQGQGRTVALGLCLANGLLGAPLSEEALHRVQADSVVKSAAAQVCERLFTEESEQFDETHLRAFYLRIKDRWQDRARYYFRYLGQYVYTAITPNEKDRAFLPLPSRLSFLHYFLRPIRLLGEWGRGLLKKHMNYTPWS